MSDHRESTDLSRAGKRFGFGLRAQPSHRAASASRRRRPLGATALKRPWVADVVVLAVVAGFLRFWRLTAVGFRGDEAVYAGQSALLAHTGGMERWFIPASRGNSNFLIYQGIVSIIYRIGGVSELAPRAVSAFFSTVTVLFVYLIARRLYGRAAGLLAGGIMAVSGYAVGLGRLALLDATACCFITAALACALMWTQSRRWPWLVGFGVLTALAMQTKVIGVLVLPIALILLITSGAWRFVRWRQFVPAVLVSLLCFAPAAYEVATAHGRLADFLSSSLKRSSDVPWDFYARLIWRDDGPVVAVLLLVGVLVTIVTVQKRDGLPLAWLVIFGAFLEIYPLKAFNYILPLLPALAVLTGRTLALLLTALSARLQRVGLAVAAAVVVLGIGASQVPALQTSITNDSSAGMREAALWLQAQGAQRAGTLALSHGSGQYVLSFYGGIDAYPFGRFRIATVLPGGQVLQAPSQDGRVPTEWVKTLPQRLIGEQKIHYLVYNTGSLDDPPEQNQVNDSITQRELMSLIQAFDGQLVHTVYWNHEARVYIYRVGATLPQPTVTLDYGGSQVVVNADGFTANSALTVTYHGVTVAHGVSDDVGSATLRLPLPSPGQAQYHLVVTDAAHNAASVTGLPATKLVYTVDGGTVRVFGSRYRPGGAIKLFYGAHPIGVTRAKPDGTFDWSFPLPTTTHTRYRIRATDDTGATAWATGLQPPQVSFVTSGRQVAVTGQYFLPDSSIGLSYGGSPVATAKSNRVGAFRVTFTLPRTAQAALRLVATDRIGRQASVTGLVR